MTPQPEDFEDRLRRVLTRAAGRVEVPAVAWQGPSQAGRRPSPSLTAERLAVLAGATVAAVIVVLALGLGSRPHAGARLGPTVQSVPHPPASALEPHFSPGTWAPILAARGQVVARDRACRAFHGSDFTRGRPAAELSLSFAVLRGRSATLPLARLLAHSASTVFPGAQLYVNQIHPVPVPFGASVWVLPAGNVTGQQGVPDRCQSEQAATLRRDLAKAPSARRIRLLSAQGRYLEYMRYLAHHPEGVCAAWVPAGANRITAGATFGCATLPDFLRWGILAVATARLHGAPVFWTVVPDPVASLTLRFGDSGRPRQLRVVPFFNVVVAQEIPSLPTRLTLRSANGRVIRSEAVNGNQLTLCGYGC